METVRLKEVVGKTIVATREVAGGYLLLFSDNTYLSVYAVHGWDTTEISDNPVNYTEDVKRELGLIL